MTHHGQAQEGNENVLKAAKKLSKNRKTIQKSGNPLKIVRFGSLEANEKQKAIGVILNVQFLILAFWVLVKSVMKNFLVST